MVVTYFTRFALDAPEHGGDQRAVQIWTMLNSAVPSKAVRIDPATPPPKWIVASQPFTRRSARLGRIVAELETGRNFGKLAPTYRHYARGLWRSARQLSKSLSSSPCQAAVLDDPFYHRPLVAGLRRQQTPIIANCHNIESLVSHQITEGFQMECLSTEIRVLRSCDFVITISKEETWILRNLGISCAYLPYYPDAVLAARRLAIRQRRQQQSFQGVLLLGTALNPPTRAGIETLMRLWARSGLRELGVNLVVAGRGTELVARDVEDSSIRREGSVSEDRLTELLVQTRACICYQEQGAGALTRITDCLIAGVPVLANPMAARSYHGIPGLTEFTSATELAKAIQQCPPNGVSFPAPMPPDATQLVERIRATIRGTRHSD